MLSDLQARLPVSDLFFKPGKVREVQIFRALAYRVRYIDLVCRVSHGITAPSTLFTAV